MKVRFSLVLLVVLTMTAAVNGFGQQEFTFTTTAANLGGIKAAIDMPGLTGNPLAIIVATPLGSTEMLNPHPIGSWYYSGKWYLVNVDSQRMPEGAKYKIQYFPQPGANQFLHVVVTANNQTVSRTALNHQELDFHPETQVKILQNHSPETRSPYYLNPSEVKVYFDSAARKWFIENVNNTALHPGTAYNVVISPYSTVPSPIDTTRNINTNGKTPMPDPIKAGGDLSGTYPNPNVIGLKGKPISDKSPEVGDILKWNGTVWESARETVAPVATPAAKPAVLFFNQSETVLIHDPQVDTAPIMGLDSQTFTVPQRSQVVFHTVIESEIGGVFQANATGVTLKVEIINSLNQVIGRSVSFFWLTFATRQTINSSGITMLPAGTYHTKVTIIRFPGGSLLEIKKFNGPNNQGGQMIIEIFPE